MAKKDLWVCDRCGKPKQNISAYTFTVGRSFDGVDTTDDWERRDICFECLSYLFACVISSSDEPVRTELFKPAAASRREVRYETHANKWANTDG